MAYTRQKESGCPIPADPGVISTYIPLTTAESNIPVYIPWDNVKLAYANAVYVGSDNISTALDGGDWEIDLELDAAGGTELMSITIPNSSAVGTVAEATFTNEASCGPLMNSNIIMIENDGHASSTVGAAMVNLYFEPMNI